MTSTTTLVGQAQRDHAKRLIDEAPDGARVVITEAKEKITDKQRRTIHMWFGEIAKHFGDRSALEVKGACHRNWGLVIRLRDPVFCWLWNKTGARLTLEKQEKFLVSGALKVSSEMSKDELSEYMDGVFREFTSEGVRLTDPSLQGYDQ